MVKGRKWAVLVLAGFFLSTLFCGIALAGGKAVVAGPPEDVNLRQVFFEKLLGVLGIDRAQLDAAVQEAAKQTADEAVQKGRITPKQRDQVQERLQQGFLFRGEPGRDLRPPRHGFCLPVVAEALGLRPQELLKALKEGKTIEEIAKAQGMTLERLQEQVLAKQKEKLHQAVEAGKITEDQADRIIQRLEQNIKSGNWLDKCLKQGSGFRGRLFRGQAEGA